MRLNMEEALNELKKTSNDLIKAIDKELGKIVLTIITNFIKIYDYLWR